jgi:hypothetical protein
MHCIAPSGLLAADEEEELEEDDDELLTDEEDGEEEEEEEEEDEGELFDSEEEGSQYTEGELEEEEGGEGADELLPPQVKPQATLAPNERPLLSDRLPSLTQSELCLCHFHHRQLDACTHPSLLLLWLCNQPGH